MKQTNIPWLGEIPEGWGVLKLSQLGKFSSSGIDKKINQTEDFVKIINYKDVYRNSRCILNDKINYMVVTASKEKISKNIVKKGDLIFTPSSETVDEIGISALVDMDLENTAFSYHVVRFAFRVDIYHSYKKYLCNNFFVLSYFSSICTGSIRKTLSRNDFNNCITIIPPLKEQEKIAKYLDEKCYSIDKAIELQKTLIEKLKEYKKSLIYEYVTGKRKVV